MAPGRIDTARSRSLDESRAQALGVSVEEQRRNVSEGIPLGRYGKPEELGRAALPALARYLLHHWGLSAGRRWLSASNPLTIALGNRL
jgi:NAD(P)-dependent dehydrogenase (short-subunit alcohol dehydrogenase family)